MELTFSLSQFLIGLGLGIAIALLAYRARALDRSGAWAAALTGLFIFGLGGFGWAVVLLTFFISSSGLSKVFGKRKQSLGEKFAKGSRRDWGQVLANGGLGSLLALLHVFTAGQLWPWLAFAGAMATVNADTWATEIGVLSKRPPRLVTTGKIIERGASGGITLLGTLATLAGGALIGLLAGLFSSEGVWKIAVAVTLAGLAGSLLDSLMGGTVQAIYRCPTCDKETERHPVHSCGTPTVQARGLSWLNNDLVNFIASLFGAAVAAGIWLLLS
jgi:uncharacterized protein (TIGR00297 family)